MWSVKYLRDIHEPACTLWDKAYRGGVANTVWLPKKLRLFVSYLNVLLSHAVAWAHRLYPHNRCVRVGNLQLIGLEDIVTRAVNIVEAFKSDSPALYDVLTGNDKLVFTFVPGLNPTTIGGRFVLMGESYLQWHDFGIRAYFVYIGYYTQKKLIHPSVRMDDYYDNKSILKQQAAMQTSRWLADHQQPDELVQYFASFGTKR